MTIQEIKTKFKIEELTSNMGDEEYRRFVFTPLIQSLHNKNVVIHGRITCLAKLEIDEISDKKFSAKVNPIKQILHNNHLDKFYENMQKGWQIASSWKVLHITSGNALGTYSSWLLWTDPVIVVRVEELIKKEKFKEALELTLMNNG